MGSGSVPALPGVVVLLTPASFPYNPPVPVTLGSARLASRLSGQRVGLVANPASVDATFRHVSETVAALPGVTLAALFGQEPGGPFQRRLPVRFQLAERS